MTQSVDILLATYQGAPYVREQLHSILNQTYPNFHIWIRDDGSKDGTKEIIHSIAQAHPNQVSLIPSYENRGAKENFSELLKYGQARYVMFCDQDDYWFPNKIELSVNHIQQLENTYGPSTPLLVHTDLTVSKSDLSKQSHSFWNYTGLNPKKDSLNRLLVQNVVTGCTMITNRCLLNLVQPIPPEAIMHDWWFALTAAAFGHIDHLNKPTLFYRQHDSNNIGAKKYGIKKFFEWQLKAPSKERESLHRTYQQAKAFLNQYANLLNHSQKTLLEAYVSLENLPYFLRKKEMIKFKFFKQGYLRNLRTFLFQ